MHYLLIACYFLSLLFIFNQADPSHFISILIPGILSCLSYFLLIKWYKESHLIPLLTFGIVVRCTACFFLPNLSMDFYRYWWDAKLLDSGFNPLQYTPREVVNQGMIISTHTLEFFNKLNSPDYRSVYPSFSQGLFYLALKISSEDLFKFSFLLKFFTILLELPGFYALYKFSIKICKCSKPLMIYFLNPLILIEAYGNLHFELVLSSFMLYGMLFILQRNYWASGFALGLSIATKIYSAILLPIILTRCGRNFFKYILAMAIPLLSMGLFIRINSPTVGGYNLYMKQFEFNSSFFILWSKLLIFLQYPEGWDYRGYVSIFVFCILGISILLIRYTQSNHPDEFFKSAFYFFILFVAVNSTVHPWYFIPLVVTGLFSFPGTVNFISCTALLSYMYYDANWKENFEWYRIFEYSLGTLIFFFEKKNPYSWNRGS